MKTIMFKTTITNRAILLILAMLLMVGCATKASKQKQVATKESAQNASDITRPPALIKETQAREFESNPEETISYDEWRQRREGAAAPVGNGSEPEEIEQPEEPTKIP